MRETATKVKTIRVYQGIVQRIVWTCKECQSVVSARSSYCEVCGRKFLPHVEEHTT